MRKHDLQFIQDTLAMKQLFHEPSLHKTAQDGMEDIMSTIKGKIGQIYDPKNPIESIVAFMGPGLLWMLGFRWLAVIYEIAAALGFNWTDFFSSIKDKLRSLLTSGKTDSADIKEAVESSANAAFSGQIDSAKVQEIAEKNASIHNMLYIKKIAIGASKDPWIMQKIEGFFSSVAGNRMRKGILGLIVRVISWVITAVLISAGFAVVGGTAAKILGIGKDKEKSQSDYGSQPSDKSLDAKNTPKRENIKLYPNPNMDPHLETTTYNDDSHVWLLNMNIADIKNTLIKWAQDVYPQLNDLKAFDASSAFVHTLKMFQDRNKGATQLDIMSVPQPFRSIREIVDSFAADVASHTQTPNQPSDAVYL